MVPFILMLNWALEASRNHHNPTDTQSITIDLCQTISNDNLALVKQIMGNPLCPDKGAFDFAFQAKLIMDDGFGMKIHQDILDILRKEGV